LSRIVARSVSRNGPPDGEIAVYARENTVCRDCGAKPGFGCVEQADRWRSVCKARFHDAAAIFAPVVEKPERAQAGSARRQDLRNLAKERRYGT